MADNETDTTPPPPNNSRQLATTHLHGLDGDEAFVAGREDGTSTHDGTETNATGDDTEREHDSLHGEIVDDMEKYSKGEKKGKNKGAIMFCCGGTLICIGLIVGLFFLFRRQDMGLARAQLDPSTNAPTFTIETDSPTPLNTLPPSAEVTPEPTTEPTPSPTLPPISPSGEKSRLSCVDINLAAAEAPGDNKGDGNFRPIVTLEDGTEVCGDTYGGQDPARPNRNYWSVSIGRRDCPRFNYAEGFEICDSVGARWCTVEEFVQEVAQGTGCGGDREFVYTNTDCFDEDKQIAGKVMFDVGLRDKRKPFFFCETDMSRLSLARCCGDAVL